MKGLAPPAEGRDWADHSQRHYEDQRLRRHGFEIHSRPKSGEPVWKRRSRSDVNQWVFYPQSLAMQVRKAEIEAIVDAQRSKSRGK